MRPTVCRGLVTRAPDAYDRRSRGGVRGAASLVHWVLLGVVAGVVTGCGPKAAPGPDSGPPPLPDMPPPAELVEAHNRRIELLGRIYSAGVLEFRWLDEEEEEHIEPQVNAKLWIELPRTTALRAEKLGEVLLWSGSDDRQYWLFDLMSDEHVVYTGRHEGPDGRVEESPLLIRPLALLDLLALTPVPVAEASAGGLGWEAEYRAEDAVWVFSTQGAGGPMRLYLDAADRLPTRVETLSPTGEVLLASRLSRYASVPVPGVSTAGRSKIPTLIDIGDPGGRVSIKLALDEPTGFVDDQPWDRVFDLERLMKALRPDRVERVGQE